MSRAEHVQFNVRSAFARARAHELAKLTGMTATEIVEDALRGYVPPGAGAKVGRLVQKGPLSSFDRLTDSASRKSRRMQRSMLHASESFEGRRASRQQCRHRDAR